METGIFQKKKTKQTTEIALKDDKFKSILISKMEMKNKGRLLLMLLLALFPTYCAGDKLHRNVLYWDCKPYIYQDKDGTLKGIYVDAVSAEQALSVEQCDPRYPKDAGRYNYTFVKMPRTEILRLYEKRQNSTNAVNAEILFPILYEPSKVNEGFLIKSEGIALVALRQYLEMSSKFIWAFFNLHNLFILTAISMLSTAITMMVLVRTSEL